MKKNLNRLAEQTTVPAHNLVDLQKEFADTPPSRLAFADSDFLLSEETRGIRLQLEILKPDLALREHHIDATVVVFGSARLRSEDEARKLLQAAQEKLLTSPQDETLQKKVNEAKCLLQEAHYYEEARTIGQIIGTYEQSASQEDKVFICTGGGPGIMEAANRGASESGSPTVGLNIVLPHEQESNHYITSDLSFRFHYFATRKMHFLMRAKALITFPGGFGTLDELFEILTLVQTRKSRPLPIVLYGSSFWKQLVNFELLVDMGMISREDLDCFQYADTPEQAWEIIQQWYGLPL